MGCWLRNGAGRSPWGRHPSLRLQQSDKQPTNRHRRIPTPRHTGSGSPAPFKLGSCRPARSGSWQGRQSSCWGGIQVRSTEPRPTVPGAARPRHSRNSAQSPYASTPCSRSDRTRRFPPGLSSASGRSHSAASVPTPSWASAATRAPGPRDRLCKVKRGMRAPWEIQEHVTAILLACVPIKSTLRW